MGQLPEVRSEVEVAEGIDQGCASGNTMELARSPSHTRGLDPLE
jgi:hypothetical protein